MLLIIVVEGLFIIGYFSGHLLLVYDIYLLNFGMTILYYEVYCKLRNGVCLLEYVVFIRYISPRHCGYTGFVEDIHVISWLRTLRSVVDL